MRLTRDFYDRPALEVARELLGKTLVLEQGGVRREGRIVECEAYVGQQDLACHSSRGRTPRTEPMFGPPGHAYVYLIYGMHHCFNAVTGAPGLAAAVLVRAVEPLEGIVPPARTDGPGRLCRAMGIDRSLDGEDLCGGKLYIAEAPPCRGARCAGARGSASSTPEGGPTGRTASGWRPARTSAVRVPALDGTARGWKVRLAMQPAEDPGTEEDRGLLEAAQAGDMAAFESLVERHRDRVYSVGLRMTRSDADAAEIAQETFLSAYQHLAGFRGEAAFGSWVHRIAANHSLMRLRHSRVVKSAEEEIKGQPDFNERGSFAQYPESDWSRRADQKVLDAELRRAIEQASDSLPEAHRQVFLLKDVNDLSYEEIAEITGDSVPAVKSRLHRARLALRDAIDRFYNAR